MQLVGRSLDKVVALQQMLCQIALCFKEWENYRTLQLMQPLVGL
ncbi:MAG TPA: hypothetical protein PLR07_07325 [Promineifilum sp.]|nr:hypothetical protein [Promineifilum sp.]